MRVSLKMGKILLLVLVAAAVATASHDVRSPGGSVWQASSGFGGGQPSAGFGRSSISGWASSGGGLVRSAGNGATSGWRRNVAFGSNRRNRGGNGNQSPAKNSWSASGDSSNGGSGGNTARSNSGWSGSLTRSVAGYDSSNGWDEPGLGFRSNNGWQSSEW